MANLNPELNDSELRQLFDKYDSLQASLDLITGLRDPVVTDCPMLVAAAQVQKQLRGFLASIDEDNLHSCEALLQKSWDLLMPPLQIFLERQRQVAFDPSNLNTLESLGIPALDEDGLLPPGMHHTSWQEFVCRFGTSDRRHRQCQGLLAALHLLRQAGCRQVHIGGSFVTAKADPTDVDYVFLSDGVDFDTLEPMLNRRQHAASRHARMHFGTDGNEGDLECLRKTKQHRTLFDAGDLLNCGKSIAHLGNIPHGRFVGTVALDLRIDLPATSDFMPGYMWDDPTTRMEMFGRF